jgi:voltage-dependent calcium channel L type alpha-1D
MLLDSMIFTISSIGPYVVFLMFFIYIFALVGMSFYAGNIKFNGKDEVDLVNGTSPRENFDTLGNSLMTLFIIIMGSWSQIMESAVRCNGGSAAVYFVLVVIIGGIILLNLFLAIMLGNF